jgi:regulator of nucleoside diphosphate kinase
LNGTADLSIVTSAAFRTVTDIIPHVIRGCVMFGKVFYITRFDFERIQKILDAMQSDECVSSVKKLKEKFKKAKLINSEDIKPNIITMNSKFVLRNLGNGMKYDYSLVFPHEADFLRNKISILDSIGAEILSLEVGSVVHSSEGGDIYYQIEHITYQPEAAGDYHL